eukprot:2329530-Prymnesium_polylepis.1
MSGRRRNRRRLAGASFVAPGSPVIVPVRCLGAINKVESSRIKIQDFKSQYATVELGFSFYRLQSAVSERTSLSSDHTSVSSDISRQHTPR